MRKSQTLIVAGVVLALCLGLPATAAAVGTGWVAQDSGTSSDLWDVSFASTSTGWAVGEGGLILSTTNGGQTWTPQVSGVTGKLHAVSAASTSAAWAVGDSGLILGTTNGGATWAVQRLGDASARLVDVDFVDSSNGWAVGEPGTVLATNNGGATWSTRVVVPSSGPEGAPSFEGVSLASSSVGFASGAGSLYYSDDGGASWQAPGEAPWDSRAIDFVDSDHGWSVGGGLAAALTTNGGDSWDSSSPHGPYGDLEDVSFVTTSTGWAVGSGTVTGGGTNGLVLATADGGVTWDYQVWTGRPGLRGIDMISDSDGWAVGDGGTILRTSDGGGLALSGTVLLSQTSNATVPYGGRRYVKSLLLGPQGPLVGKPIVLQYSYDRKKWYSYSGAYNSYTNNEGLATALTPRLNRNTYFRMFFKGDDTHTSNVSTEHSLPVLVRVRAYVRTPIAPKTMRRGRYYSVYGWLKPRHTAGTYPVRIYKWKKTSTGRWKSYGYVYAKAYNYSSYTKYLRKIKLTSRGKWRLRAYARADSRHSAAWSSGYDYVTVK